ncbi:hypothetical protein CC80DRAFT_509360 [Byssothecium circinans]|uniref:Uncharacterized protein n=1 Tax=Byssothecium circinans TaxID=147558 RepID=A0A6A5TDU4_9PLEO|nr:hypothetical protein CC80DRAFT_509360 [Byssothecium circinans]
MPPLPIEQDDTREQDVTTKTFPLPHSATSRPNHDNKVRAATEAAEQPQSLDGNVNTRESMLLAAKLLEDASGLIALLQQELQARDGTINDLREKLSHYEGAEACTEHNISEATANHNKERAKLTAQLEGTNDSVVHEEDEDQIQVEDDDSMEAEVYTPRSAEPRKANGKQTSGSKLVNSIDWVIYIPTDEPKNDKVQDGNDEEDNHHIEDDDHIQVFEALPSST